MTKLTPLLILLTWVSAPFVAWLIGNSVFIALISVLLIYFIYKITVFSIGSVIGYASYRIELNQNWIKQIKKENKPKHIIAIPVYKEEFSIVERLLDSIVKQTYPLEEFRVVISIEERYYNDSYLDTLEKKYNKGFVKNISIIPHKLKHNEVAGAASNRTNAVKYFVDNTDEDTSNFLITSPDCDTVFHPKYFSRVSFEYLKDNRNNNNVYQTGIYTFSNNIEHSNALIQIISYGITLSLMSLAAIHPKERYTFSCFSMSLKTLIEIDYWDTSIPIDDAPLYWRAAKKRHKPLHSKAFFIPVSVDATEGTSFLNTLQKQLKQFYRWGWGIVFFPDAIAFIRHSSYPVVRKIKVIFFLLENIVLQSTWVFVLSSFFFIFNQFIDSGSFLLHTAINVIGISGLLSLIPVFFIKLNLAREINTNHSRRIFLVSLVELPLTVVLVLVFGIYPLFRAYWDFAFSKNKLGKVQWAEKLTKISQ